MPLEGSQLVVSGSDAAGNRSKFFQAMQRLLIDGAALIKITIERLVYNSFGVFHGLLRSSVLLTLFHA
jgi:hypothetical protein